MTRVSKFQFLGDMPNRFSSLSTALWNKYAKEHFSKTYSKVKIFVFSLFRQEIKLIVGSSNTSQKGWISTEQSYFNLLDLSSMTKFVGRKNVSRILMEHVLEHLTQEEIAIALNNLRKVLSINGSIRVAVPDGFHPSPWYQIQTGINGTEPGADDHKSSLNFVNLSRAAIDAGYEIHLLEYFTEEGTFICEPYSEDKGRIERSSQNYRGRLTDNQADIEEFFGSMEIADAEYLKSKGISYTSLIADLSIRYSNG